MQEFIKKLIARLEEEKTRMEQMYIDNLSRPGTNLTLRLNGKVQGMEKAIYIANQLAEEYEECYKDCGECEAYDKDKHHCPKFCKVITEAVAEIEENHPGWISCSERLPKSGVTVIVSYKDRFLGDGTCEGWYDAPNEMWHLTDYEYSDNAEVTYWRERLAPYQPKGD